MGYKRYAADIADAGMMDSGTGRQSQGFGIRFDGIDDGLTESARLASEVVALALAAIGRPALCFM